MRKLLRPTNEYAPRVILPGDPALALDLAQELIEGPLMANHARGLWGYTGPAAGGSHDELSIQSTGYGGQSAAAVMTQLAGLGVRQAVRIGTCLSLDGSPAGSSLVIDAAFGHDGAEHRAGERLSKLLAAARPDAKPGRVVSVDTVAAAELLDTAATAVDGATAGLYGAAAEAGVAVAAALLVVGADDQELDDEKTRGALLRLGRSAFEALVTTGSPPALDVGGVKRW